MYLTYPTGYVQIVPKENANTMKARYKVISQLLKAKKPFTVSYSPEIVPDYQPHEITLAR